MSFKDLTPAQRRAMQQKSAQTRANKKAARRTAEQAGAAEIPPTLADLGLTAAPEDDYRIDPDEILTNEEIAQIRAEARAKVVAEQKKARRDLVRNLAMEDARRELGLIPVDEERERELAEMTQIKITLPRLKTPTGRMLDPDPIILDQRLFMHGRTYQVTKAVSEYLWDRMGRAWEHNAQVHGESRVYHNEQLGFSVAMNGFAPAAGGGGFGMSFDAIHRRPA